MIYNPVVTPEILEKAEEPLNHPWFAPGEPPVILSAGRLTRTKDYPLLFELLLWCAQERPARLMILGEGEERPKVESLGAGAGLR